jgi:hypothetical protein
MATENEKLNLTLPGEEEPNPEVEAYLQSLVEQLAGDQIQGADDPEAAKAEILESLKAKIATTVKEPWFEIVFISTTADDNYVCMMDMDIWYADPPGKKVVLKYPYRVTYTPTDEGSLTPMLFACHADNVELKREDIKEFGWPVRPLQKATYQDIVRANIEARQEAAAANAQAAMDYAATFDVDAEGNELTEEQKALQERMKTNRVEGTNTRN